MTPFRIELDEQCPTVELNRCWQPVITRRRRLINRARSGGDRQLRAAAQILRFGLRLSGLRTQAPDCATADTATQAHNERKTPARTPRGGSANAMMKLRSLSASPAALDISADRGRTQCGDARLRARGDHEQSVFSPASNCRRHGSPRPTSRPGSTPPACGFMRS
jgi:hypothetical protein